MIEGDGILRIARPSGRSDLICRVTPLNLPQASLPTIDVREAACVFVNDPDTAVRVPRDMLISLFGLTAREAQLAELLASGLGLDAAAEQLGITRESARTYLKRVLGKTRTRRQSELVSLLVRMAQP